MSAWLPHAYPRGRGQIQLIQGPVLSELVIDNPKARNAMSLGMMADLLDAVDRLRADPPLALLIRGQGSVAFCAGGDLKEVRAHLMDRAAAEGMPIAMGDALDTLAELPSVVVVAVEGAALGGGAEITTVADWVVVSESAQIGFVHAALGVSPGWGGARRLIQRIGAGPATEVLLQAPRLNADRCFELGLAQSIAPQGEAVAVARAWVDRVTRWPHASIRGLLEILRTARSGGDLKRIERRVFSELWAADDHCAALELVKAGE